MKYLIFDLDDTLLNSDKKLSNYTIKVLRRASKSNYKIVINSARTIKLCSYLKTIIPIDYFITDGGSQIYDSNLNIINQKVFSEDLIEKILKRLYEFDEVKEITIQTLEDLYTDDYDYSQRNKRAKYADLLSLNMKATKIIVKSDNEKVLNKVKEQFNLNLTKYFDSNIYRLSLSSKYLGNMLLKETLCDNDFMDYSFGDDHGDLEMINNSYHGVLMKNADINLHSKVKNVSEYTNDEDGCGKFVEKMLDEKPNVCFICIHNSCRSQIAEALSKHFCIDTFNSYSCGTELKPIINQDAVRLVKELYDIDMSNYKSKLLDDVIKCDINISMGCGVSCPITLGGFDDDWKLEDPTGKSDDEFKKVIKQIEMKVLKLRDEINSARR